MNIISENFEECHEEEVMDQGEFGDKGEFKLFIKNLGFKYNEIPSFDDISFIDEYNKME